MGGLTFFFDRNLGKRLPEALNYLRPPFEVQSFKTQRFPEELPDDEWLEIAGKNHWYVFAHDRKFHSESVEAAAILQHKVGCFYLPGASSSRWDKLVCFMRGLNRIYGAIERTPRPFIFNLAENGYLKRVRTDAF